MKVKKILSNVGHLSSLNLSKTVLVIATGIAATSTASAQEDIFSLNTQLKGAATLSPSLVPARQPSLIAPGIPSRLPGIATGVQPTTDARIPDNARNLRLFGDDWKNLPWISEFGKFEEIKREQRKPIDTDKLDLMPVTAEDKEEETSQYEQVPPVDQLKGVAEFEFFDIHSNRTFSYTAKQSDLAGFSRLISESDDENSPGDEPLSKDEIRLEDARKKAWSNANDSRTRRGSTDGYSDTNNIYQSIANYGGCSATVLTANSTRMVAITAAHCVFTEDYTFNYSKIEPRKDGSASPTWGRWTPYAFGYYAGYIDSDCEANWNGSRCIKHDIALVIASPDAGATAPRGMGWGYRNKSYLNGNSSKYRRGYPGCSSSDSPLNCNGDTLYGDGRLAVGNFSKLDSDLWNRQIRHSSDTNPGDSGSSMYYYRNNHPYVFAVHSASQDCDESCSSSRPNYARRITPQFFDIINSVVF